MMNNNGINESPGFSLRRKKGTIWIMIMLLLFIIIISILFVRYRSASSHQTREESSVKTCSLSKHLRKEIDSYKGVLKDIVTTAVNGSFKGFTWEELGKFVDKFGSRFSGTASLENSIDYMLEKSRNLSLENVHGEPVMIPHWVRGSESASLILPRQKDIALLGLGYSVGTPVEGIVAEAIVVKNFAELQQKAKEISGKIVVYNQDFESYDRTVKYRYVGANEAAKLGAVAVLIRSVTPVSLYTPHAGILNRKYSENNTKIPAASITIEDAELLYRLQNRGETLKIQLKMEAKMLPDVESRNLVVELAGDKQPEKVVVVSGHIDSWDVGQGAMDDAGGAFLSWSSLVLLKKLNLRPKRTIRGILWTAEEIGTIGSKKYIKNHEGEKKNLQFVMESDSGTFKPLGLVVSGNDQVQCIVHRILKFLKPLGSLNIKKGMSGPDLQDWLQMGVPGAGLWNQNDRYFWYHHTNADTFLLEDPSSLDAGTALFAAVSYVLADISIDLPHGNTS